MQDFRDLEVWQKAHRFVLHIYESLDHEVQEIKRMTAALVGRVKPA